MKRSLRKCLTVLLLIFLTIGVVAAQQNVSPASLREQISQLQRMAQSPDTPSAKAATLKLLAEKRAQLRTSLEMQLGALRKYQASYQSRFSARENQNVLDSIRSLEAELQALISGTRRDYPTDSMSPERGHAERAQRMPSPAVVTTPPVRSPAAVNSRTEQTLTRRLESSSVARNPLPAAPIESQRVRSVRAANTARILTGAMLRPAGLAGAGAADPAGTLAISWNNARGAPPCPAKAATGVTYRLIGINDLFVDFDDGSKMIYQLTVDRSARSAVPNENPFGPQSGLDAAATCAITAANLPGMLANIRYAVSRDPRISRHSPGGMSVSLTTTAQAARNIPEVACILDRLATNSHDPVFDGVKTNAVFQWIQKIEGEHQVDLPPVTLEETYTYDFKFEEMWKGEPTEGGMIKVSCGESDLFSLSLGPIISTLPSRTYNLQKALVPPGSSTSLDVLSVGNKKNINILGAALLNYHLPRMSWLPREMGLAISAGPVYTLGSTPGVSALGLFVGPTMHVNRSIFITPGLHVGQFADFPEGFAPGTPIPNQFGALHPVTRTTAHFAIGLTYKTASFKSKGGASPPSNGAGGGGGSNSNQPSGNHETGGNQGSGTPPANNEKPKLNP